MKTKLLFLLLYYSGAFAQMQLEHSYADGIVIPIQLPSYGFKYYYADETNNAVIIYNSDHSVWKTIPLVLAPNTQNFYIQNVTENTFAPDTELEIMHMDVSDTGYSTVIQKESGTVLLQQLQLSCYLDDALPAKLIGTDVTGQHVVYDAASLTLEATYPSDIKRIFLAQSGFKYQSFDQQTGIVSLFSADHTPWKTINISAVGGEGHFPFETLEQNDSNGVPKVNICFTYYTLNFYVNRFGAVINEDGVILATIPNTIFFYYDNRPELGAPKLYASTKISNDDSFVDSNVILSFPGFEVEHAYTDAVYGKRNLGPSGIKYAQLGFKSGTPAIYHIYNEDHTLWKSFPLVVSAPYNAREVFDVSENIFNGNPQVEVFYGIYSPQPGGATVAGVLSDETGSLLQTIPNMLSSHVIDDGTNKKIFGRMTMGIDALNQFSNVYSISNTLGNLPFESKTISLYPNPATDMLQINAKENIISAELFDLDGRKLSSKTDANITQFDMSFLSPGCYIIQLRDVAHHKITRKITKI